MLHFKFNDFFLFKKHVHVQSSLNYAHVQVDPKPKHSICKYAVLDRKMDRVYFKTKGPFIRNGMYLHT